MKTKLYPVSFVLALSFSAQAALYTYAGGDAAIPDNQTIGLAESINEVSEAGTDISDVTLTFTLAGGYGTDLSGYLRLGNESGSSFYSLTGLMHADPIISASGVTYTADVTSVFTGQNPNNTWTLFFADTSPGGMTTLDNGWTLAITAVPEPANVALALFGGIFLIAGGSQWWRRRQAAELLIQGRRETEECAGRKLIQQRHRSYVV